eukprot:PLAT2773.1.p3 GENE.PLAT2773.1~~PLAT2773.1.p3  ORF type:complete len:121 (+),score=54.20 PLAT2773.1:89-451(+)
MGKEDDIVTEVSRFFYESEEFMDTFVQFAQKRQDEIDAESEEYRLVYTDMYKDFLKLFEETLTGFIEDKGSTVEEFYDCLRTAGLEDPGSERASFAQILNATIDFDIFMQFMKEVKEGKM